MLRKIYKLQLLIIVLLTQGCAAGEPRAEQRIEQLLRSHGAADAVIAAPESAQPAPWRVGQWATYRVIDDHGESAYLKLSVVGEALCGIWLETDLQGYHGRTTQKLCYRSMPPAGRRDSADAAKNLVTVMVTRIDDGAAIVADFSDPGHKYAKALFAEVGKASRVNFYLGLDLAQEDVTAPAGRFLLAFRYHGAADFAWYHGDATVWTHPEVPVTGIVRLLGEGKYTAELLAYGQSGAASELPSPP